MARRADHTRDQLTELVLQSAIEIIETERFSEFSIRKVAKHVGYTVGMVSHLFGNADGLILQINGRTLDLWFESLQAAVAGKQGVTALQALAKAYLTFSQDHANLWAMLFDPALDGRRDVPDWYRDKLDRFFLLVEQIVQPFVDNTAKQAADVACVLWAGIHGIAVLGHTHKLSLSGSVSADDLAKQFIATYVDGLLAA